MLKKFIKTFLVAALCTVALPSFSQDSEDFEYTREFIWGVNKNTNGGLIGGFVFKYSQALTPTTFRSFGLELMNVKHPKEVKYVHYNGNSYIFKKQNYLYAVRLQYGREKIVFKKAPQQGVQVTAMVSLGPTLGVIAPYYVQVTEGGFTTTKPYKPNSGLHTSNITGTGGIFEGLGESDLTVGANLKASLSFEFGTFKNSVSGFEAGFLLEAFPKEIVLMPDASNRSVFTSAFITILFGTRR